MVGTGFSDRLPNTLSVPASPVLIDKNLEAADRINDEQLRPDPGSTHSLDHFSCFVISVFNGRYDFVRTGFLVLLHPEVKFAVGALGRAQAYSGRNPLERHRRFPPQPRRNRCLTALWLRSQLLHREASNKQIPIRSAQLNPLGSSSAHAQAFPRLRPRSRGAARRRPRANHSRGRVQRWCRE